MTRDMKYMLPRINNPSLQDTAKSLSQTGLASISSPSKSRVVPNNIGSNMSGIMSIMSQMTSIAGNTLFSDNNEGFASLQEQNAEKASNQKKKTITDSIASGIAMLGSIIAMCL